VVVMLVVVIVAAAGAVLTVVMVVVMMVLVFLVIMIVIVVMTAAGAALAVFMVMVVMMMLMLLMLVVVVVMLLLFRQKLLQLIVQCVLLRHCLQQLCAGQLIPLGRHDRRSGIAGTQTVYAIVQLLLRQTGGVAQDQAACIGDLVVKELAEVLLIHLALLGIYHSREAIQLHPLCVEILHGTDDVAQLAHTGRLDQNAVGVILLQHLLQCLAEIAHKAAANTAGVHLGDLHAGILQKSAVNADLTKLVLDQHQLLSGICLSNQLLDERGLASAQKS